jgi:phytanoyl-CoA hydroxylase
VKVERPAVPAARRAATDHEEESNVNVLSAAEVARYRETGWLVVPDVIDPAMLARAHAVIDGLVQRAAGVTRHDDVFDLESTHTPERPRVRRIKKPHVIDPLFWQLVRSPKLLAIQKQLIGSENLRLHGSKLNMKSPQYGAPVEWHTDWAFYPHTNDDILAVGVFLDDMREDNGPLMVMSGTHREPRTWDHHANGYFCGAIDPAASGLDFARAEAALGPAGSCSFHHVRLVHGSAQNTSDRRRRLLLYETTAADSWPLVNWTNLDEFNSRMICGEPTLEPRLEKVPVRMPYPPALAQGSIYENQTALENRFFRVTAT